MPDAAYDEFAGFYLDFVARVVAHSKFFNQTLQTVVDILGDVQGKRICDLACGEGYLSRILAAHGADVTGVDLSSNLLEHARRRSRGLEIDFICDDAQTLQTVEDHSFDIVVCYMALMDIPDMRATFGASWRILRHGGIFLFSILHPCFETPFTVPDSNVETDVDGNFVACRVKRYTEEGPWNSGGTGVRGRVGAHHRKLSTVINGLLESGFGLISLAEPTLPQGEYATLEDQRSSKIPRALIVESVKR